MSKNRLSAAEWLAISTICGAMLGIGIASLSSQKDIQNRSLKNKHTLVDISIVGAVEKPGVYQVPVNTRLKEAIEMSTALLPEANTQKIKWKSSVRQGQVVRVAKKRKKTKKFNSSIVEKSVV